MFVDRLHKSVIYYLCNLRIDIAVHTCYNITIVKEGMKLRLDNHKYIIIYELVKNKTWVVGSVFFKKAKIKRDISMSLVEFWNIFIKGE